MHHLTRTRREMCQQDSDEVQAVFHDVSSYFSEEEWKPLHEWQKALYRNVMKEIHQALISLGPLIATTMFSLRALEKEEPCPMENQDSMGKHAINHCPSELRTKPDVLFRVHREEALHPNTPKDSEGKESKDCLSSGAEEGHEVVSFRIKDEEETYCMDLQDNKKIESITGPTAAGPVITSVFSLHHRLEETPLQEDRATEETNTGDGLINRNRKDGDSIKCKVTTPLTVQSGNANASESSEKETYHGSQLWSKPNQERGGENTIQYESGFSNPAHSSLIQGTYNVERLSKHNTFDSNLRNANLPACSSNTQLNTGADCVESFRQMGDLTRYPKANTNPERMNPYQCTACKKTFYRKGALLADHGTYTGEKPHHCHECEKSVSANGKLVSPQRRHSPEREVFRKKSYTCRKCGKGYPSSQNAANQQSTIIEGEPYQCSECEKSLRFNIDISKHQTTYTCIGMSAKKKSNLKILNERERPHQVNERGESLSHAVGGDWYQRTCTSNRPYQCTECGKSFHLKVGLVAHEGTHTGDKRFNSKLLFGRHQRIHTSAKNFSCTVCEKRFRKNYDLVKHLRIHTGERPFSCTDCEKRFSDKSNFLKHQKIHNREGPFSCTECEKKFNQKSDLIKHHQIHTPREQIPNVTGLETVNWTTEG